MEQKRNLALEIRPVVPPGHNAWVIGNEPLVAIDFTGAKQYAKEVTN